MAALKDQVIVITGASAGIGAALAEKLAAQGAHLVLAARRANRLQALAKKLDQYPGERLAIAGDISQERFAKNLINHAVAQFGRIDVVVNNAGIGHVSELSAIPPEDMRQIWDTNVLGLSWLSQAAMAQMKSQLPHPQSNKRGQIINISSIVSQRPLRFSAVYTASKVAVNHLTRALRMEVAGHQITVTLVYPGLTQTEFHAARLGEDRPSRFGRMGVPADKVAAAIERAIMRQRTEVYITFMDWAFVHINRLFPRLTDLVFARVQT